MEKLFIIILLVVSNISSYAQDSNPDFTEEGNPFALMLDVDAVSFIFESEDGETDNTSNALSGGIVAGVKLEDPFYIFVEPKYAVVGIKGHGATTSTTLDVGFMIRDSLLLAGQLTLFDYQTVSTGMTNTSTTTSIADTLIITGKVGFHVTKKESWDSKKSYSAGVEMKYVKSEDAATFATGLFFMFGI